MGQPSFHRHWECFVRPRSGPGGRHLFASPFQHPSLPEMSCPLSSQPRGIHQVPVDLFKWPPLTSRAGTASGQPLGPSLSHRSLGGRPGVQPRRDDLPTFWAAEGAIFLSSIFTANGVALIAFWVATRCRNLLSYLQRGRPSIHCCRGHLAHLLVGHW